MDESISPRRFVPLPPGVYIHGVAEVFVTTDGEGRLWQVDTIAGVCQPITEVTYPLEGVSFKVIRDLDGFPTGVTMTFNVKRDQFEALPEDFRCAALRAFSGME